MNRPTLIPVPRHALTRRLTRRALLSRVVAIGLAPAVVGLLAACGADDPGEAPVDVDAAAPEETPVEDVETTPTAEETDEATPEDTLGTPPGGTAVVAHYALFGDLDPGKLPDFAGWMPMQNICEALVEMRRSADGEIEIVPVLAESYDMADDGLAWTFALREGISFHDGTPFDAEAVVFSHERVMDPDHPYYRDAFVGLSNALNAVIETVEAVDDRTVRMTLKSPASPYFLNWESFTRIVSPTAVEMYGDEFGSYLVGTGPFKLDRFDFAAKEIEMSRNPDYWQPGMPKLDRIVWRVVGESATRLAMLETGAADVATIIPPEFAERIENNPQLALHAAETPNFNMIGFYRTVPPFNNIRLRQAIAHALDRDTLAQILYFGYWTGANNNRWPGMPGWEDYTPYPYDPDRARELLAEAGYPGGFEFTLDMPTTSSGNPADQRWGEAILEQLSAVGIRATLNVLDPGSFWPLISEPREGTAHFMTRQVIVGDVVNEWLITWAKANPPADTPVTGLPELYDQLQAASDPEEYDDIVRRMWRVVDDELPYVAIARGSWLTGLRAALKDVEPQGIGEYLLFRRAYLEA